MKSVICDKNGFDSSAIIMASGVSAGMLASYGCLRTSTGCHSVSEVVGEIHLGLRKYPVDDGLWDPTLRMTAQRRK